MDLLGAIWPVLWATEIFVGFLLWRLVLRGSYARVGPWPLALAYALFSAVLFASLLVEAGMRFAEAFYGFFFAINFALPAVTLSRVPLAAYFARVNDLNLVVAGILGMIVVLVTIVLRAGLGPGADGTTFVELILASAAFFTGMIVSINSQGRRHSTPNDGALTNRAPHGEAVSRREQHRNVLGR